MYQVVSKSYLFTGYDYLSKGFFTQVFANSVFVFFDPVLFSFFIAACCAAYAYKRSRHNIQATKFVGKRTLDLCTGIENEALLVKTKRLIPDAAYFPYAINLPRTRSSFRGFRKFKVQIYVSCYTKRNSSVYGRFGTDAVVNPVILKVARAAATDLAASFTYAYLRHFFVMRVNLIANWIPKVFPRYIDYDFYTKAAVKVLLKTTRLGQHYLFDRFFIFRGDDEYLADFEDMHSCGKLNFKIDYFQNAFLVNETSSQKRAIVSNFNNYALNAHYCILSYNLLLDGSSLGAFAAADALHTSVLLRLKAANIYVGSSGFIVCNTIKFQNIFNANGSRKPDNYYDEDTDFLTKNYLRVSSLHQKILKFIVQLFVKKNK